MISKSDLNENASRITKVDEDGSNGLSIYHYTGCNDDDSFVIKQSRGVIVYKDNVITTSFGYTPEYSTRDENKIKEYFTNVDLSKCLFFDSHEGCLIRCLFINGEWIIATHKRLKAFESRWSSRLSFGDIFRNAITNEFLSNEQFKNRLLSVSRQSDIDILNKITKNSPERDLNEVFEIFIDSLDKGKQHMFFIRNNFENYIVCNPPQTETVFYVGSSKIDSTLGPYDNLEFQDFGIPSPIKHEINTVENLIETAKNVDIFNIQGILVYVPSGNGKNGYTLCKVVKNEYLDYAIARNNEPSIRHRYLSLRTDTRNSDLIDKLCYLYPHYIGKFDHIEYILSLITNTIYKSYVDRYIKRRHVVVPKEEYKIMKECYDWYCSDNRRRISRRVIMNILNRQSSQFLNLLIKNYTSDRRSQNVNNQTQTQPQPLLPPQLQQPQQPQQ